MRHTTAIQAMLAFQTSPCISTLTFTLADSKGQGMGPQTTEIECRLVFGGQQHRKCPGSQMDVHYYQVNREWGAHA